MLLRGLPLVLPPGVIVISHYKPFKKSALPDYSHKQWFGLEQLMVYLSSSWSLPLGVSNYTNAQGRAEFVTAYNG